MMARGVDHICRKHGWDYPFLQARPALRADITFGNLECPVSNRGTRMSRLFTFRADPACLPALKRAGFNALSVANNHAMDYGRPALADTLSGLEAQQIVPVGAGRTYAEAVHGRIIRKGRLRIGFLGFSAFPSVAGIYSPSEPSVAVMSDERLTQCVRDLKRRCDLVVVSCHWGLEGVTHHSRMQERLAHRAIDAGASLVLGHHPHVPQEIERYHGGVIVYSLGNFVFDEFSRGGNSGLLFRCRLSRRGVTSFSTRPVKIEHCRAVLTGDRLAEPVRRAGQ